MDPSWHEVWWGLLSMRIDELRPTIPANLHGTIQFVGLSTNWQMHYFFLVVDGPRTVYRKGQLESADVTVRLDNGRLRGLLLGAVSPRPIFEAAGAVALFTDLLEFLGSIDSPQSLLALRSSR